MYTILITFILVFAIKLFYHSIKINQIEKAGIKGDFHQFVVSGMYKRNLNIEKRLRDKKKRK